MTGKYDHEILRRTEYIHVVSSMTFSHTVMLRYIYSIAKHGLQTTSVC